MARLMLCLILLLISFASGCQCVERITVNIQDEKHGVAYEVAVYRKE